MSEQVANKKDEQSLEHQFHLIQKLANGNVNIVAVNLL